METTYFVGNWYIYQGWLYYCDDETTESDLYCAASYMGHGDTLLSLRGYKHDWVSAQDCTKVFPIDDEVKWRVRCWFREIRDFFFCTRTE